MNITWHDEAVPERLTPERRRQLTRDALMDAAEQVFVKKGFGAASMEEIAAAAGFSRGAIYSNFGTKHELLLAVLDRFMSRQLAQFTAPAGTDDPVAAARDAADVFNRSASLDHVPLELELRLNALRHPAVRHRLVEADRQVSESTARLTEAMIAERGEFTVPARDIADIGRAAVTGLLQYAATDPNQADRYLQLVETLFVLLTAAVTASPATTPSRPGRDARRRP